MDDLISRQAAIRFIRDKVSLSLFMKRSVDKADKACAELCDMLDRDLPSAQPEQRWIPVTERLPEAFQSFYATCKSNIDDRENWVIEGYYTPWSGFNPPPLVEEGKAEIIAWIPKELPEPWKGTEDELSFN